jgi:glycosyltransferase involved in cell wall biosynthesis
VTSSPPIRLAYLVSQYPTISHTFILREIRGLRDLGFDLTVISIRPPDRPQDRLSEVELAEFRQTFTVLSAGIAAILGAHVSTFFRRPIRYLGGLWYALRLAGLDLRDAFSNLFYFAEAVVAGREMERKGLTHLHTHFSSTVALLLVRVFPFTFSATIHGSAEFICPAAFYTAEKIRHAKFLCVISNYGASQLMKESPPSEWNKFETVRLGVDCSSYTPRPHRDHPDPFELICVGSLAPMKGQAMLIRAVGRLVKEGRREVHLRLVGGGVTRPDLERMISEFGLSSHVTLEGACNQERVQEFYRQSDLFALGSFAEGLPVVLMEAMAMEIPCIATRITGVPELIRHGVDGWLVTPADEEELASAIAQLMDDSDARQRLGKAGRIRVQELYELSTNVRLLADVFKTHLSEPKN